MATVGRGRGGEGREGERKGEGGATGRHEAEGVLPDAAMERVSYWGLLGG